jgi:hypothetical protein
MPSMPCGARARLVVGLAMLLALIPTGSALAGGAAGPWPW